MQATREPNQPNVRLASLSSIRPGQRVCVVGVNAGRNMQGRLLAMGLIKGAEISVISKAGHGPLLISLGESRMTIGHGMAEKIIVT